MSTEPTDESSIITDGQGREITQARKLKLFHLAELICSGQHTQAECLRKAGFNPNNRHLLKSPAYLHVERVVAMSYRMDTVQHKREVIGLTLEIAWDKDEVIPKDRLKALELLARWSGMEPGQLPNHGDPPKTERNPEVQAILAEVIPDE
jgi:hypothetical protein